MLALWLRVRSSWCRSSVAWILSLRRILLRYFQRLHVINSLHHVLSSTGLTTWFMSFHFFIANLRCSTQCHDVTKCNANPYCMVVLHACIHVPMIQPFAMAALAMADPNRNKWSEKSSPDDPLQAEC